MTLQTINLSRKINKKLNDNHVFLTSIQLNKLENNTINKIKITSFFAQQHEKILELILKDEENASIKIEKIITNPRFANKYNVATWEAKIHYYQCLRLQAYYHQNIKEAYKYAEKITNLISLKIKLLNDNTLLTDYLSIQHTCMVYSSALKDFEAFELHNRTLEQLFLSNKKLKQQHFPLSFIAKTLHIENNRLLDQLPDIIEAFEKELKTHKNIMFNERIIIIYFNIACLLVLTNQYQKALKWINLLLTNQSTGSIRKDVFCVARIMNLIIHYELKNYALVLNYSNNYINRYELSKSNYLIEKVVLNFIKSNPLVDKKNKIGKFQNLLTDLRKAKNIPSEKIIFRNFDFIKWTENKINQLTKNLK